MRHNPRHFSDDPDLVRRLVREHPWATIVSSNHGDLVASHYPVMLDPHHELALLTHLGRPD
ncbi:MAG TPA: FMN-binding negative transcriptional regulator, partial [Aeromicrobium sp.]|nr:FMN-binding negative transcriptional regulator [Aeromicrobium sp.]